MTTYSRVVLTSGTSLFNKNNEFGPWFDRSPSVTRKGFHLLPTTTDACEAVSALSEAFQREHLASRTDRGRSPESFDHTRISAEISMIEALRRGHRLANAPHISVVYSDTFEGELAAELNRRVMESSFDATVTLVRASDLGVANRQRLNQCLGTFMGRVHEELQKGEPSTTCFAPLGGYKIMTALGYVVGCVLGFPMAYLHEAEQQQLHIVPPLTINLDHQRGEVTIHARWLRKLAQGSMTISSLSEAQTQFLTRLPHLFERADDLVEISALGTYLLGQSLAPVVKFASEAADTARRAGLKGFALAQCRELVYELTAPEAHRGTLRHEVDFETETESHLFKGASGAAGMFRAVYRVNPETDEVEIAKIWLKHDVYVREAVAALREPWPKVWVDLA